MLMLRVLVGTNHRPRTTCRNRKEQRYGDPHIALGCGPIFFLTTRLPFLPPLPYISFTFLHPLSLAASLGAEDLALHEFVH
jgi:hypothetical protein